MTSIRKDALSNFGAYFYKDALVDYSYLNIRLSLGLPIPKPKWLLIEFFSWCSLLVWGNGDDSLSYIIFCIWWHDLGLGYLYGVIIKECSQMYGLLFWAFFKLYLIDKENIFFVNIRHKIVEITKVIHILYLAIFFIE